MNRKETTEFLSNLLMQKINGRGKYWAKEVSLDYGTRDVKRVDFMEFKPDGVVGISEIEKGIFHCYEIKSCKADFNSGFGRNFIAEKNYYVMPMCLYKEVMQEIPHNVGVLVPVPYLANKHEEFEHPTEFTDTGIRWELCVIKRAGWRDGGVR